MNKKTGRRLQWVLLALAATMLGLSFVVPASLGDGAPLVSENEH